MKSKPTITDAGRAMLALHEEKENLQREAEACNRHTQKLIQSFNQSMYQVSTTQRRILEKMSEIDKTMCSISSTTWYN